MKRRKLPSRAFMCLGSYYQCDLGPVLSYWILNLIPFYFLKRRKSIAAQEWSWHTFPGPQTCRIRIPLPYHELGLPNIDPNNDKGSY